jgi:ribosomal protein S27AE
VDIENLQVDLKRRHKEDGEPCPIGCGGKLRANHDNFACQGCGYVDWDNHNLPRTGVYVRARSPIGGYGNYDISELDDESLDFYVNQRLSDDGRWRLILVLLGRPTKS